MDTWTIGGTAYTEGASGIASSSGVSGLCQPLVDAFVDTGDVAAYIAVDYLAGGDSSTEVDVIADASIIGTPQSGTAAISYYSTGSFACAADTGSVTLTAVGANGGRIIGSYSVTAWAIPTSCPTTPYTGSFNVTRNDTNLFEAD